MPTTTNVLLVSGARVLAGPPPAMPAGVRSMGGWALDTGGDNRVERLAAVGRGAAALDVASGASSCAGASVAFSTTGIGTGVGSLRVVARTGARGGWIVDGVGMAGAGVAGAGVAVAGSAGGSVGTSATGV